MDGDVFCATVIDLQLVYPPIQGVVCANVHVILLKYAWLTLAQGGIKMKMINFPNWITPHCQNALHLTSLACPFTVPTAPRWTACAQLNVSACRNAVTSCQLKSNLMHMKVF